MSFFDSIKSRVKDTFANGDLTAAERAVIFEIWETRHGGRVSQAQIAASQPWIGSHPEYDKTTYETTLRQVRQVIRDLRVKHGVPIVSDRDGYFIPRTDEEASAYLNAMEREVRARAASSLETYRAMQASLGVSNTFLDRLALE